MPQSPQPTNPRQPSVEQPGSDGPARGELRTALPPIFALLLGLGLAYGPMLAKGPHQVPGGLGDTRLVHFSLEHGHRWLLAVEGHRPLWDPPIFYPARGTAAYTDTLVSLLPFYSPWRWLGAAPETAFQIWWLCVFGLNFAAFFVYLRRIFGLSTLAASAGAYLFTFGSSRLVDIGHPQMMPWFYVVAALFALHRLRQATLCQATLRQATLRQAIEPGDPPFAPWLALLCIAVTLQAYAAVYPLFFLVLGVACCGLVALAWSLLRRPARRQLGERLRHFLGRSPTAHGVAWVVVAVLALVAITPLARQYLAIRQSLGERDWNAIEPLIPRPSSWLLMGPGNRLYGGLSDAKAESQPGWQARSGNHNNGLGYGTLGIVALGVVLAGRRRRLLLPLLGGCLLMVVLATVYPGGFTPWYWLYGHLPGAGAIRAVGRLGMVLLIPAGAAFGILVDRLAAHRRLRWGLPLLVGLVIVEQLHVLPSFDGRAVYRRTNQLAAALPLGCSTFLLTPAVQGRGPSIHEDAMWMTLVSGVPTINGRYGNTPLGWGLGEIASRQGMAADEIARRLDIWLRFQKMDRDSVCWLQVETPGVRLEAVSLQL